MKNIIISFFYISSFIFSNMCSGMYFFHPHMLDKNNKINKPTIKKIQRKIILSSFATRASGKKQTGKYFEKILPSDDISISQNPFFSSFYQKNEIEALKKTYDQIFEKSKNNKNEKIFLGGLCKGASIAATTCGTYNLKDKKLAGIFLESPTSSLEDLTDYISYSMPKCLRKIVYLLVLAESRAPNYNPNGIHPIDVAKNINNIPVLFIIPKNDLSIPTCTSLKLAKEMSKTNKKIYVYMPNLSTHGILFSKNPEIIKEYKQVLEIFFDMCSNKYSIKPWYRMKKYKKTNKELTKLTKEYYKNPKKDYFLSAAKTIANRTKDFIVVYYCLSLIESGLHRVKRFVKNSEL